VVRPNSERRGRMRYWRFKRDPASNKPLGSWPAFYHELNQHESATVVVMDAEQEYTDRQRRWYKGVCLKGLSEWNGESKDQWDARLKSICGSELFKFRAIEVDGKHVVVPDSISARSKRQMTEFIENILAKAIEMDWPVYPPDPDLRRQT